jgi:hypothetical protein
MISPKTAKRYSTCDSRNQCPMDSRINNRTIAKGKSWRKRARREAKDEARTENSPRMVADKIFHFFEDGQPPYEE